MNSETIGTKDDWNAWKYQREITTLSQSSWIRGTNKT